MADNSNLGEFPQAMVEPGRRSRVSAVWIIPFIAALVALGIAYRRISNEGPEITLVFKAAEGMEAGKTIIKYKDVKIGQVTAVRLADDLERVELTAKIEKSVADAMVEDAAFWVVQPRIGISGISGLSTLLSGNYIGFEPGKSTQQQLNFIGLDSPPALAGDKHGKQFVLKADDLGSVGVGSPIYHRRVEVGQVISYQLAADGHEVDFQIFIDAPNDKYVHPGTRFWNVSGFNVSIGTNGVDIRTESVLAMLEGGLAFDTPDFEPQAEAAAESSIFRVYDDALEAMKPPEYVSTPFVLNFDESLRGLSVGAPVTLFGLSVGEVTDVGLTFDSVKRSLRPQAHATVFLERLTALLPEDQAAAYKASRGQDVKAQLSLFRHMVEDEGMRAQLQSGSLLSGQKYVALDFFPSAPKATIDWSRGELEMPVNASTIPDLEAKLTSILTKVEQLPFESIGTQMQEVIASMKQMISDANKLLARADSELVPEVKSTFTELNSTVVELRSMIAAAEHAMQGAESTLIGPNAPAQAELRSVLQEVAQAARAFRLLTDYLERHPEALIRGKSQQ